MTLLIEDIGQIRVITLNRPEKLNAMSLQMVADLKDAWRDFHADPTAEVAILTGAGRGFCAGEDLVESAARGVPQNDILTTDDPMGIIASPKPVIAAINGVCFGGGFLMAEKADLRLSVPGALFEVSEAKRWLVGGWTHGMLANLPHPIAAEMAYGFRFTSDRLHALGFLNRLVEPDRLLAEARGMAEQLLALPPASRVNTTHMLRTIRPRPTDAEADLGLRLHAHGAHADLVESRQAFAEKRPPVYVGWDDPADRFALPQLDAR